MNDQYATLAELAGGFIHEIKNHLSTLGLNLQLLAEDFTDAESQRERRALQRVEKLQRECERLVRISNDFLRFARIKELNRKPADLGKTIEEIVDFFTPTAIAANIQIKTFVPADLPAVTLDVDLFKQALLNLMLNAEQAMPEGGQITIQAARDPGSEKLVCLSIIDTGKGMSEDVLSNIFKPFYSTRKGGTGLGLPTTRRIIEAHEGSIIAESEVGRGTRFAIRLLAAEGTAAQAAVPSVSSPPPPDRAQTP